jgi:hypothetical protein
MKTLDQCNWKEFRLEDIFTIDPGVRLTTANMTMGKRPFIGATDSNNGITAFVDNTNKSLDSNVLGVNYNGSVVENFYHPYEAIFSDDVKRLHLKEVENNKYICLFIKQSLLKQKAKYQYGYKFNGERMKKQYIMLPSTPEGTPDYTFMEEYMRQKEQTILAKYKAHISNILDNQSVIGGGKSSNVNWKEFYFTDVFTEIQRGKRLKRADHSNGKMPYVSSTALCNGVDGFVGNTESVNIFSNCITIANSGSVGSAFFHSYEFVASDHVTKLQNKEVSKYAYLFMLPIINRLAEKYSFNREINDKRIKRERFVLPATPEGTPDFAYMDAYMRNIELQQLLKYLQHLNVCL